jgi:predicted MFS family arabinose efflux permease
VAPPIGFWVYHFGWRTLCIEACALNVLMAAVAWTLPDQRPPRAETPAPRRLIEWRVLVLATALFLCSYGYGGLTSFTALYADANHVAPKSLYLTTLAVMILVTRPLLGRVGDRIGYRRVLVPSMVLIACGLACLVVGGSRGWLLASAVIFGAGWSTAYPAFIGYVMRGVGPERRGAAFGAVLAAFDTGIGTGSISMGWLIGRYGFRAAFAAAAILGACSLPYFLLVDRRFGGR